MKTAEEIDRLIRQTEHTLYTTTYQPHIVAALVERIKALKWALGELEL